MLLMCVLFVFVYVIKLGICLKIVYNCPDLLLKILGK